MIRSKRGLSNHCCTAATCCSNGVMANLLRLLWRRAAEADVAGQACAVVARGLVAGPVPWIH